jgi:cytochrome c-type biogenesis protein CcmF
LHPASYFALWVASFVVIAILFEFYKGVRARMKRGENPLQALARLVGRNHRRYGGYVIHLGVMMIGLAFIGDVYFQEETQRALAKGESMQLGSYQLRFDNLEMYAGSDGREVLEATTSLYKDGNFLRTLHPRRDFFVVQQQPVTIPAVYTTPAEDIYVLLVGWEEVGLSSSTFKIYRNPLIIWAWVGSLVLILGTGIAVWPQARRRRQESYALRPSRRPTARPAPQAVTGD